MATRIKDIIKYYIRHNVSDKLKERVLDRVSNTWDDGEATKYFEIYGIRLILLIWKKKKSLPHTTGSLKLKTQRKRQR